MASCTTSVEDEKAVVTFSSRITIEHAREVRDALAEILPQVSVVELATAEVAAVDISFLQILVALSTSLDAAGKHLQFTGDELAETIRAAALTAGFFRFLSEEAAQSNTARLHEKIYGKRGTA